MAPITVSWSEIASFRQCPKQWDFQYQQRWKPPTTSPALNKGSLWHTLMEEHYNIIREFRTPGTSKIGSLGENLTNAANELLIPPDGNPSEIEDLVMWMYSGYIECFGSDPDWKIVGVEHEAEVPLDEDGSIMFKMKIDLIIRDKMNHLWLIDHKTGQNLPKDLELSLDDQFGLYTWGMRKLGHPVMGAMRSSARTQRNLSFMPLETRFSRIMLNRTEAELNRIAAEARHTVHMMRFVSNDPPRFPNPDTCRWKCGFTEPCLAGRKGVNERDFLLDAGYLQDFTRH